MPAKRPKAEVARRRRHFRFVPLAEVARRRWHFRFVPISDIAAVHIVCEMTYSQLFRLDLGWLRKRGGFERPPETYAGPML